MMLIVLIAWVVFWASTSQAQSLNWMGSQSQAVELALRESKQILLLAGADNCYECDYMHNTVCEKVDPTIKPLILDAYVPWFCNTADSEEWRPYADGLSSFPLPLICIISPTNLATYVDRSFGIQSPKNFYNRLLNNAGIQLTNAKLERLSISNRVAQITMSQLTFGASQTLERSAGLNQLDGWLEVTNFVSLSRTNCVFDALEKGWTNVFYRIKSGP